MYHLHPDTRMLPSVEALPMKPLDAATDDLCRACHGPGGQRACLNCGAPVCAVHNPFVPPDGCEQCCLRGTRYGRGMMADLKEIHRCLMTAWDQPAPTI